MGVIILYLTVLAVISAWWLSQQRLMAKPWLEAGAIGGAAASPVSAPKLGLGLFIVVASTLFTLLLSAYSMRKQMGDWRALPVPELLWLNTFVLVLSSIALQWARIAARRKKIENLKISLLAAGACSVAFLVGQTLAWRQLADTGFSLASNPANAFFYLLTAAHAFHVVGGLVALGRTSGRVWRSGLTSRSCLGVELCAIYWHFLLLVWLMLFALLLVEPDSFSEFLARCVQLVPGQR